MIFKNKQLVFTQLIYEFALLNLCVFLVLLYINSNDGVPSIATGQSAMADFYNVGLIFNFSWIVIVLYHGQPEFYTAANFRKHLKKIALDTFIFVGIAYTLAAVFNANLFYRTTLLAPIFLFSFLNLSVFRLLFEYKKRNGRLAFNSQVLIVGAEREEKKAAEFSKKIRQKGYGLVGVLDNDARALNGAYFSQNLGRVDDLAAVLERTPVDEIFITLSSLREEEIKTAIETADYYGVRVNLVSPSPEYLNGGSYRSFTLDDLPVFKLRNTPLDKFNNFLLKKTFDIVFSLAVLILLSPIFLLLGLLIVLESRGPVFYTPLRKGEGGNTFKCYKFRTMKVCDDPVNGTQSTVKNDPRITRIGKYLRKYDLDELPQFFNVLKGDMSVVGPRPHRVHLHLDFRRIVNDYMVRHYVKPGITGWAQVNGWRGPTQTIVQKTERIKHDLWYIEHWSFLLDIKIIFLTVFGKKTRKNAF